MLAWALVLASAVALTSGLVNDGACLRNQGSFCCPQLTPIDRSIQETLKTQPIYETFLPKTEDSVKIDNVCNTYFLLPENPDAILTYVSRVYSDGQTQVRSYVISQPELGVIRYGDGLCNFVSTVIADLGECNMRILHRCSLAGDCSHVESLDTTIGILGTSANREPISESCISRVSTVVKQYGLPSGEYHILPMRLPSRCVLNQVCSVLPTIQRFCQAVDIAFPNFNCKQTLF